MIGNKGKKSNSKARNQGLIASGGSYNSAYTQPLLPKQQALQKDVSKAKVY